MAIHPQKIPAKRQGGSFILEALIGLVLFATGIIALMGMAAQAVNDVGQSKYRNDASDLAQELVGEMWISAATPDAFDLSTWESRVQSRLPAGDDTVTVRADGITVDIEITWSDKKDGGNDVRHRYLTTATIAKNT